MKRDHFPLFTPLKKALSRHLTIFSYKVTCQEFQYSDIRHSIQFRVTHLSSTNVYPLPRIVSDNPWNRLRVLVAWLNLTKTEISAKVGFNNTAIYLGCCNPRAIPLNARLLRTLGIPWISQFVFSKVPKCLPRPQRLCAWTPLRSRPNSQQQSNQAEAEATLRTAHKSCHYFQVSKILAISIFIKMRHSCSVWNAGQKDNSLTLI